MALNAIRSVVDKLNKICSALVAVDMVAMFIVLLIQIFVRFIMPSLAISWSMDMICFLLVISVFLGAGVATGAGKQIRLEIFADMLPKTLQKIVFTLADVVSIVFLCVVTTQSVRLGLENITVVVGASPVRFGWYYLVVALGCIIMIVNFLLIILNRFIPVKDAAKAEEKEGTEE